MKHKLDEAKFRKVTIEMNAEANHFDLSLDGISRFGDLIERIKDIPNYAPPVLKVIFISFYQEFLSNFIAHTEIFYRDKIGSRISIVRERELLRSKFDTSQFHEAEPKLFVFDTVTSPETLATIVQLLEGGHTVHVFAQWDYRGKEKRSAFSILLRNCVTNAQLSSISEISMWSEHIQKRIKTIQVIQLLEFT